MGSLIFTWRKLGLKQEINRKQTRMMMLQLDLNTATENTSKYQQYMADQKSNFNMFASNALQNAQREIMQKYPDGKIPVAEQANVNMQLQMKQYEILQGTATQNSVFDARSKSDLKVMSGYETQLQTEKAALETELKTLNTELEGVEKAEDDSIKKEAPKFGLS